MGDDKWKQLKGSAWVHKALEKEFEFDLEHAPETFMEEKQSFTESSTSGSKDKPDQEMDPFMLMTILETYTKLLCDRKAVKGFQELINR